MLNEKVVEPVTAKIEKGKELAAPYIEKGKELADPYVTKLAELRKSERVESMIAAFQQVRTHTPPYPSRVPAFCPTLRPRPYPRCRLSDRSRPSSALSPGARAPGREGF